MTDAQISHSANNAPSGPTAMQQNALKASCHGTGSPASICLPLDEASE